MSSNETCSHCDGTGMVPELYGQPCGCQDTPMTTNDATRAALVDIVAESMYDTDGQRTNHGSLDLLEFRDAWDAKKNRYRRMAESAIRAVNDNRLLADRAVPEPDADVVKHLQEFADMFHFAWGLWAAQDGATPLETEHLKRAMDDVFWSDMILKWLEMVEECIIANPGLEAQDREIEGVKNRPAWLLPEHTRAALAAVPPVQAAAGDAPGLDGLMDSAEAQFVSIQHFGGKKYEAMVMGYDSSWGGSGHGASPIAAIQNAVEAAKEQDDEDSR